MDFYRIKTRPAKNGVTEVYPDFVVRRSSDLMVRGNKFYAIWDDDIKLWSKDEYDVQRLIDRHIFKAFDEIDETTEGRVVPKTLGDFSTGVWRQFKQYLGLLADNSHDLDDYLTFASDETQKSDYASKRLPYDLAESGTPTESWDKLMSVLYYPEERQKIEWVIGAIISGDSKDIQKFMVLYGAPGTGKGSVLNVVMKLFEGYYTTFEAKALAGSTNAFATEVFRHNPLVGIQHDADLSRIEDNTKLNSIISHEEMVMNEKYKASYTSRINAFLIMGSNKPVQITDAKSGIIRRLIDVQPTGNTLQPNEYHSIMNRIDFELGAIARRCLDVYRSLGKNYYNSYQPVEMMLLTDPFYNFVEYYYEQFLSAGGTTLTQAYEMYRQYMEDSNFNHAMNRNRFREELKSYFNDFQERGYDASGNRQRSVYSGFKHEKFDIIKEETEEIPLVLDQTESILDDILKDKPAQPATKEDTPYRKWASIHTTLKDIDTSVVHFVKPDDNHIVIDFDIRNDDGEKDAAKNLEAASKFPPTYAEYSKSGKGIHLHYIYEGDVSKLAKLYDRDIEIKTFTGGSSLRRRLTKCNKTPIAKIKEGLPTEERKEKNMDEAVLKNERGLRSLIVRNLRKEIHPHTKPSVDFIHKILDDAYYGGMQYDVSDMRQDILNFAASSTNQAMAGIKKVGDMKFKSEEVLEKPVDEEGETPIVIFDVEVFPNLFVVSWKYLDSNNVTTMINPTPGDIEKLLDYRLVGFNNRRYDNHILYGRLIGYDNQSLYELSQKMINSTGPVGFGEAYNLSYADIYEFSSEKKSLKRFQVDLGIHHKEFNHPWDQPVPEELWEEVVRYCENDVRTTETVWHSRASDFKAREIIAHLSGLSVNTGSRNHAAKIIFGGDKNPQDHFVYTDLSEEFPGYKFEAGKSSYKGVDPSEGGYVYSEPGIYEDVIVLDVTSMHPTSIEQLNLFGKYTENFSRLKNARVALKSGDVETANKLLDTDLSVFVEEEGDVNLLSNALKLVINSVYGYTAASFDNPFRDIRNIDNIVAKRGALFMIDLVEFCRDRGLTVVHVKTDSIKLSGYTPEDVEAVMEFGLKYGYEFETEATYDRFVLIDKATYVGFDGRSWEATGATFIHPYVFKTLFSKEELVFDDYVEVKQVSTAIYMDYGYRTRPATTEPPQDDLRFVGRVGAFVAVNEGCEGATLRRQDKDGSFSMVSGASDAIFMIADEAYSQEDWFECIDLNYYEKLAFDAKNKIAKFGEFNYAY